MTFNIRWSRKKIIISCKCRIGEFLCCQPANKEKLWYWFWIFAELQSDKSLKYLNRDWLIHEHSKRLSVQGNARLVQDLFWRNYWHTGKPIYFKLFKYSSSLNLPRVWICQSNISHPFFNVRTKQRFHTFDANTSWKDTNPPPSKKGLSRLNNFELNT